MKPLNLDKQQRKKLLKMVKILFPEYYWKPVYEGDDVDNQAYLDGENIFHFEYIVKYFKGGIQVDYALIPWFEFVFLHLIGRLQDALPEKEVWREQPPYVGNIFEWKEGAKWTLYTEFHFTYPKACSGGSAYPPNPIDWLYEQFKLIK